MTRDELIEQAASAFRATDRDGRVRASPAFFDLGEAERVRAFDAASASRKLEAALDPRALSSTARAVLARILAAR